MILIETFCKFVTYLKETRKIIKMKTLDNIKLDHKLVLDVKVTASNEIDLWLNVDAAEAVEMDDLCLRSSYHEMVI